MLTICRFITAAIKQSASVKLSFLIHSIVVCSFITCAFHMMGMLTLTTFFGPASFGIACSSCYSMMLSIPSEFGLKFKPEQISTIMFLPSFSFMFITSSVGYLMSSHIDYLLYSLALISVILWVDIRWKLELIKK